MNQLLFGAARKVLARTRRALTHPLTLRGGEVVQ